MTADGIHVSGKLVTQDYTYLDVVSLFPYRSNVEAVNSFLNFMLPKATVNIDKFNWPQD